jgi:hypothetical protein
MRASAEEAEGKDGEGKQEEAANLSAALAAFAFGELAGGGWGHECFASFSRGFGCRAQACAEALQNVPQGLKPQLRKGYFWHG